MIHHGSYATTGLWFFCASAFAAQLPHRLGTPLIVVHVLAFAAFWGLPMRTLQTGPPPKAWSVPAATVMVAAAACFVALSARPPRSGSRDRQTGQ
jgi:hypothetical protein